MKQGLKEFGRILLAIIVIVWAIGIVVKIGNKVYKSVKKNNITQQKFDTKSIKDSKRFKDMIKKLKINLRDGMNKEFRDFLTNKYS